jgi:hypothetical protein
LTIIGLAVATRVPIRDLVLLLVDVEVDDDAEDGDDGDASKATATAVRKSRASFVACTNNDRKQTCEQS